MSSRALRRIRSRPTWRGRWGRASGVRRTCEDIQQTKLVINTTLNNDNNDTNQAKALPNIGPPGGGRRPGFAHGGAEELLGGGGGPPPGMGTGVLISGLGPGGAAHGGGPDDDGLS